MGSLWVAGPVLVGLGGGEGESLSRCMGEEERPSGEEQA